MTTPDTNRRSSDDIDLLHVLQVLRRGWIPLLTAPLLLGAATYVLSSQQAPTFESTTSLMSTMQDNSNDVLRGSQVVASQLPQGAVDEVVHSRASVTRMQKAIEASDLPAEIKRAINLDLGTELANDKYSRVTVKSRLDQQQRGVYDLRSSAESPEAARVLADAAAQALLAWDVERARTGVTRARQNIQQQVDALNQRINALPKGSLEAQSLIAARGQLLLNLSQATVFEQGASGNLTLLAEANAPRRPVSPKPLRNAALVLLLSLFAGAGLALLLDALRRRVRSTADITALGAPVIGEVARLPRTKRGQVVGLTRTGALYEAAGFIRVNLATHLPATGAVLVVTSSRPGEGKSTVAAMTATTFASTGKRVLLLDMDLHRPSQHEYWSRAGRPWVPLPGNTGALRGDIATALQHPRQASAIDLGGDLHFLPAGETGRRSAALLSMPELPELLRQWATEYDIVIVDTPPVLALADAYNIGRHADGVMLVVESGETSVPEVQKVLTNFATTGMPLLGVVVNKVDRATQGYYYSYGYSPRTTD